MNELDEIQTRLDAALEHQTLEPSDYAELAWASAHDAARMVAIVRAADGLVREWDATGHLVAKAFAHELQTAITAALKDQS